MAPVSPEITSNSHSGNWEDAGQSRLYIFKVWPASSLGFGGIIWIAHPLLLRLWLGYHTQLYLLAGLPSSGLASAGSRIPIPFSSTVFGLMARSQAAFSLAMVIPGILIPTVLGRLYGPVGHCPRLYYLLNSRSDYLAGLYFTTRFAGENSASDAGGPFKIPPSPLCCLPVQKNSMSDNQSKQKRERTLIVRLDHLGDVLLTTPLIRAAVKAGHEVHVLVREAARRPSPAIPR